MSLETASKIADGAAKLCPHARVEFAMRGEPTMNPKYLDIIALFRKKMPRCQLMITTNGDTIRGHMQERVKKMFDAGLDFVLLDTYYPKERRDALRREAYELLDIEVVDYFKEMHPKGTGNFQGLSPYSRNGLHNTVILMDDIQVHDGEASSRMVKTHAGSNPTSSIPEPLMKSCGRPFREIVIHSNGDVPICCDDWQKEMIVGNINDSSLTDIWQSQEFEAVRARLYHKDRGFGICAGCDAPGAPRFGLLPVYDEPTRGQIKLTNMMYEKKTPLWKK
jgi:radical SAM protein with 4Fe4S-binding SPASM domain